LSNEQEKVQIPDFPIVIKLVAPIIIRNSDGVEIDRRDEVRILREPEYGDLKKLKAVRSDGPMDGPLQLWTDCPAAMTSKLKLRDILAIEAALAPFVQTAGIGTSF
jgi:hypothetical protein